MKIKAALIAMIMSLVLIAVVVAGCAEGNITGQAIQEKDSSPGSWPEGKVANQSAVSVNIEDSAGDSEGGQCFVDGESLAEIFAGSGSL